MTDPRRSARAFPALLIPSGKSARILFVQTVSRALALMLAFLPVTEAQADQAPSIKAPSPRISSFSPSSGLPFSIITIKGANLNPATQLRITFADAQGYSVTVPALSATGSSIKVSLPPYVDGSDNLASGRVSVKVTETPASGSAVSTNSLSGLQIQSPPASSMPSGSYLLAMLQAVELADTNLQTALSGNSIYTASVQQALAGQLGAVNNLITQVQGVMGGGQGFTIATQNGANVAVDSTALAEADGMVLSLISVLTRPPTSLSAITDRNLDGQGQSDATGPNPIQVAAQAALAARTLPQLQTAMYNLVSALSEFAQQNPKLMATVYGLVFAGAVVGGAALAAGGVTPLVLAAGLAFYIGLDELSAPIALFSVAALSAAASTVVKVACASLNGTKEGVWQVISEFTGGIVEKLVLGGEYLSAASAWQDAQELLTCAKRVIPIPKAGVYSFGCNVDISSLTCCDPSGNNCDTVSGSSTSVGPYSFPLPKISFSKLDAAVCSALDALDNSVFTCSGCALSCGGGCIYGSSTNNDFTWTDSCTSTQMDCGPQTGTISCTFAPQ